MFWGCVGFLCACECIREIPKKCTIRGTAGVDPASLPSRWRIQHCCSCGIGPSYGWIPSPGLRIPTCLRCSQKKDKCYKESDKDCKNDKMTICLPLVDAILEKAGSVKTGDSVHRQHDRPFFVCLVFLLLGFLSFFFFFSLSWAPPTTYGGSQARG